MQEISKSLRLRLAARPEPQEHPDPDVLTAYSEQLLSAEERREVVLHLAHCSYCREIISLSLPQAVPEQVTLPALRQSHFWIPAFRWGAAVAMLAIAATLIVEKPWKQTVTPPLPSAQVAVIQKDAQTPADTPAAPVTTTSPANDSLPAAETQPNTSNRLRAAVVPEPPTTQHITAYVPQALGSVAALAKSAPASPPVVTAPASRLVTASPSREPANPPVINATSAEINRSAGRDYVNTNVLRNEAPLANNAFVATDTNNLPQAPAARNTNGVASKAMGRSFPPISSDVESRSFAVNVTTPNTTAAPDAGPSEGTTLKTSNGFLRFPSKVGQKAGEVVREIQRAGVLGGQPSALAGSSVTKKPRIGDDANAENAERIPLFHINPDGILMKSTDYTRWHQAYPPQSSDLQFKVLVTSGEQVWAGGSNATLIHSWNGGVQWETLKVPDSGDITAITIDDGWEVKTSNGQTFVSQDHGRSWVPLQTQPK